MTWQLSHSAPLCGLCLTPNRSLETGPGIPGEKWAPKPSWDPVKPSLLETWWYQMGREESVAVLQTWGLKEGTGWIQGLKKEKKQSWWPAAFLKGALRHDGKYNYGADPGLDMTLESCQPLIRFWQTLLGFWLARRTPSHQCPPPPTLSPTQPRQCIPQCDSVELQQNSHPSPKVGPRGAAILFPPEHLLPRRRLWWPPRKNSQTYLHASPMPILLRCLLGV